jgi:predicted GNAT superfamily acetyltransferase
MLPDMQRLVRGESPEPAALAEAEQAAAAAARVAGVQLRTLEVPAELAAVRGLYEGIWQHDGTNPPVAVELLRAMVKAGNYVAGAYVGDLMVGACVGFFSPPARVSLHSHIAGVADGMRGRSIGFALKTHQRAWALGQGVREICWTFDPLVRRNAYFNFGKLAAAASEYLPNFYGPMGDSINGTDDSDRLLVSWQLAAPEVVAACAGRPAEPDPAGAVVGLAADAAGAPVVGRLDAARIRVAVPADIEQLRQSDPAAARAWRVVLRDVLGGLLAAGGRITGFSRQGWYLVEAP